MQEQEERQIAIYDSAEKIQGAEPEPAADACSPEPAAAATAAEAQPEAAAPVSAYILPPLELLNSPRVSDPASYQRDIMEQCAILEQTLADFKVRAKVIAVTRGPSVTRFELEPAPGVKVSSVVNLADDIALRLAAPGVRIEAPIPGKSAIGIEAPNTKNDTVCFREVVEDAKVRLAPSKLCIGLGKDISGDIISADLSKMPHLLVAGSTGSGKSVCINTIIAGILYKARPEEVKLILVDPADRVLGEGEKLAIHRQGLLHRAFSLFLQNEAGELLLQRRALEKYHSGGLWTNSCCSHPFPGTELAGCVAIRAKEELGVEASELRELGQFVYYKDFGDGL